MKSISIRLIAVVALVVLAFPFSLLARSSSENVERVAAPIYSAQTLPRSEDFISLEDWIRRNYTEYLVQDSLDLSTVGNYNSVSFATRNGSATDFNLLMDVGSSLVLLTTAPTKSIDTSLDENAVGEGWKSKAATSCDTAQNRCNCVLYARCLVPSLPFGLTTYTNKVAIINSYSASVGSVAIMNIYPPYGHVAVVTAVTKDLKGNVTSITLNEANYQSCKVGTRTGSPSTLKVTGYFRPR